MSSNGRKPHATRSGSVPLTDSQRRIIRSSLKTVEEEVFECKRLLQGHDTEQAFVVYDDAFDRALTSHLLDILNSFMSDLRKIAYLADIQPTHESTHRHLAGYMSSCWEVIEDIRSHGLGAYGEVHPSVSKRIDPLIDSATSFIRTFLDAMKEHDQQNDVYKRNQQLTGTNSDDTFRQETTMKTVIEAVRAMEILDSRGNPTIRVFCNLSNGVEASASVPSGASTGENEAVELRDGDAKRYGGKGVLQAVENVNTVINPALVGKDPTHQIEIDRLMVELDGTPNRSKLGANAILGVSMAVARAAAQACGTPLYTYLGGPTAGRIPIPMMNILNGGKHADNSVDFQEFMVMPVGAPSFREALRYGAETFHALKKILGKQGYATGVGDEGGFAPNLKSNDEACDVIVEAIKVAGYKPGKDIAIALDPAASSFYEDGAYNLSRSGEGVKTSAELTKLYSRWIERYPIVSIEDGLAENDWSGFVEHTAVLGEKIQIVGDDIYVTNTSFIRRGIREKATNAVLIKLNQIGTVTETVEAIALCRAAGWGYVISHRSGETEDTFMADFAVAMGGGQIKTGSACRSERIAKYNRLLEIEAELGAAATFSTPFGDA